jgi:anti-anti-sigma factor
MEIKHKVENRVATLTLMGNFTFQVQQEFNNETSNLLALDWDKLEINFNDISSLDSSALGMLLMLREKTTGMGRSIVLTHCKGQIRNILGIANFQKIFTIM